MIDAYTKVMAWIGEGHTRDELAKVLCVSKPTLQIRLDELKSGSVAAWRYAEVCNLADFLGCELGEFRD